MQTVQALEYGNLFHCTFWSHWKKVMYFISMIVLFSQPNIYRFFNQNTFIWEVKWQVLFNEHFIKLKFD